MKPWQWWVRRLGVALVLAGLVLILAAYFFGSPL